MQATQLVDARTKNIFGLPVRHWMNKLSEPPSWQTMPKLRDESRLH
jgi:hypothetical protein